MFIMIIYNYFLVLTRGFESDVSLYINNYEFLKFDCIGKTQDINYNNKKHVN